MDEEEKEWRNKKMIDLVVVGRRRKRCAREGDENYMKDATHQQGPIRMLDDPMAV